MKARLPIVLFVAGLAAIALVAGCGDSPTTPTPPASVKPAAAATAPTVTAVSISGNTSLTAAGETSQFTATSTLSDGSSRNVTNDVQWRSQNTAVAVISASGLVTSVAVGAAYVYATYASSGRTLFSRALLVQITPQDTFVAFGRVREPGLGSIEGVRAVEQDSGRSVLTNGDGEYSFGGLTSAHLRFEKDGYESAQLEGRAGEYGDVPLQKVVRIAAGESVTPLQIAPHDMDYEIDAESRCSPCRLIRIQNDVPNTYHFVVSWTESRSTLNLWVNGRLYAGVGRGPSQIAADIPLAVGEALVYVGANSDSFYVPFRLTTAMISDHP